MTKDTEDLLKDTEDLFEMLEKIARHNAALLAPVVERVKGLCDAFEYFEKKKEQERAEQKESAEVADES